jgi:hypothetical protein
MVPLLNASSSAGGDSPAAKTSGEPA